MKYKTENMVFLPITLNITDKKILLVGGGKAALQKTQVLLRFTSNITIVAKEICPELYEYDITRICKSYEKSDLDGFYVVFSCTQIHELNKQVFDDAHSLGILVNVVDDPPLSDFVSPAIYKKGYMTVSVGSNAKAVLESIALRDKIKDYLENG